MNVPGYFSYVSFSISLSAVAALIFFPFPLPFDELLEVRTPLSLLLEIGEWVDGGETADSVSLTNFKSGPSSSIVES